MDKKFILVFSLIFFIGFAFATSCPPTIPVTYQGTVSFEGELLEEDYIIKAVLDGETYDPNELDNGNYYLDVSPCYGTVGEISFVINGIEANEKIDYNSDDWGKEINLDLTFNELPPIEDVCGNGMIETGEECDDYNGESGDGCSLNCQVEFGYNCVGQPSVCTKEFFCGDGTCNNGESCSTCSQDCGGCTNTDDDNGGGSSGGSSSGTSTTSPTSSNPVATTEVETEEEKEETFGFSEERETTNSGITGAVIGFAKSGVGVGVMSALVILILGILLTASKKKTHVKIEVKEIIEEKKEEEVETEEEEEVEEKTKPKKKAKKKKKS
jgi:cysteine-rich repeat protein